MGSSESTPQDQPSGAPPEVAGGEKIYLHVYEPSNPQQNQQVAGFGVFHTGIEIMGQEYSFAGGQGSSGSGVFAQRPKEMPPGGQWKYKQTEYLGSIKMDYKTWQTTLKKIESSFPANRYDMLAKNCNHFTEHVATAIGLGSRYPGWVNRAAKMGNNFRGLMGQGAAPGVTPPPQPEKSVFESSKGYSMTDAQPKKSSSSKAAAPSERKNPWKDPNFMPGGKKPTQNADGTAESTTSAQPAATTKVS